MRRCEEVTEPVNTGPLQMLPRDHKLKILPAVDIRVVADIEFTFQFQIVVVGVLDGKRECSDVGIRVASQHHVVVHDVVPSSLLHVGFHMYSIPSAVVR